jgi:hypothetical protein
MNRRCYGAPLLRLNTPLPGSSAHLEAREALLDAEVRIGEILAAMPKVQGARTDLELIPSTEYKLPKLEAAKQLGFNRQQVERFQTLAANKDLVEQVKQEAREAPPGCRGKDRGDFGGDAEGNISSQMG